MRKLPLAGALYQQQQHALARHTGGDVPSQGVRTAPTPSQPPTPYAEGEKPLPGVEHTEEAQADLDEAPEVDKVEEVVEATKEKCVITEPSSSGVAATNPPDIVAQVPASSASSPPDAEESKADTDSLADLDIVAVSADTREPPDMESPDLDTPPEMPDTPDDSRDSPAISLPDAPSSEPSSPDLKVQN